MTLSPVNRRLRDEPVVVRAPATSANLGPGFDALGLALDWHDEITARVISDGVRVDASGEGCADIPDDETHLVIRSMRRTFHALGVPQPGIALACRNRIPHGRGMGSSAAAIVSGVLAARALVLDGDAMLDTDAALRLAAELEGHPDNVAPCLLGGLTIAWSDVVQPGASPGRSRALRLELHRDVRLVVLIPPFSASTALARGLLPATVPHGDAAFVAGRAALLVAALTEDPAVLFDATEDRLHQSYRAPAMPQAARLVERLRSAGLPAVLSGAGPSVLVLGSSAAQVAGVDRYLPAGWRVGPTAGDPTGSQVSVATANAGS